MGLIVLIGCESNSASKRKVFSGTLEMTEYQIGPKVSGQIVEMDIEEGARVKQGDIVAIMDRYEQTKKDYERLKGLYEQGGATLQALEHAQLAMDDQVVKAPINGVVLIKVHEKGESVLAGAPVVVLGDEQDQWVKIFVPMRVVNQIQDNQEVQVGFDGIGQRFKAKVKSIAPKAEFTPRNVQTPEERVTQAFAIKVSMEENVPAHPGVAVDVYF